MNNDPQLQSLDPKLREAYERVMGTNMQQPATASGQQSTPPAPPDPTPSEPSPPPLPPMPEPTAPPVQEMVQLQAEPSVAAASPAPMPGEPQATQASPSGTGEASTTFVAYQNPQNHKEGPNKISMPVMAAGGIVFLAAYGFLWIKIFGLSLF